MSTNYYWRHNEMWGGECFDELHIGKQSWGWTFSLQGHFEPIRITTWAEWKEHIRSRGYVVDEYGVEVPVEEFIADVEDSRQPGHRRQYDWMIEHYGRRDPVHKLDVVEPFADWLDEDGFSFHGGEFS